MVLTVLAVTMRMSDNEVLEAHDGAGGVAEARGSAGGTCDTPGMTYGGDGTPRCC